MAEDRENKSKKAVQKIRRLLAEVSLLLDEVDGGEGEKKPKKGAHKEAGRKRYQGAEYLVEDGVNGPTLVEKRGEEASSAPIKVPKAVYMLVAEVIGASESALRFDEIIQRAGERSSAAPGEFQVRVCLRFWVSTKPPLMERIRGRYQSKASEDFVTSAERTWVDNFRRSG